MAATTISNFNQVPHNGAYGNKSVGVGIGNVFGTGVVANDTMDLVKIPAGATVLSGFLTIATAITTSTVQVGVRYADGTSTGGTTGATVLGAAILLGTASSAQPFRMVPFTNDADTIVYMTWLDGAASTEGNPLVAQVDYIANGTR